MRTMRRLIKKSCEKMGFTDFLEAEDGQKAWEVLTAKENHIGFVISDWNMPNCSGLDLLKRVRADSRFKPLPFMLLTAESEQKQIMEAVASGVDNYIVKPFTNETLQLKMEQVYKKKCA